MDSIINGIAQANLNAVGAAGHEQEKRNILTNLRAVPQGFAFESIDGIIADDVEDFNAAKIEIDRTFQDIFQRYGLNGALKCGTDYADYIAIRVAVQNLHNGIDDERSYAAVLRFIISSVVALPDVDGVDGIRHLDKQRGERTFSKMCLNLAVKLALDRYNWVDGFWTKKQMTDFPDL